MPKHVIIPCERCSKPIECKANSFTKCQCSYVQLNLNEIQYVSENWEGCMCAKCLMELKEEYTISLSNTSNNYPSPCLISLPLTFVSVVLHDPDISSLSLVIWK